MILPRFSSRVSFDKPPLAVFQFSAMPRSDARHFTTALIGGT
jgi:hypothetical protein